MLDGCWWVNLSTSRWVPPAALWWQEGMVLAAVPARMGGRASRQAQWREELRKSARAPLGPSQDLLLPEEGDGFVCLRCPLRDVVEEDIGQVHATTLLCVRCARAHVVHAMCAALPHGRVPDSPALHKPGSAAAPSHAPPAAAGPTFTLQLPPCTSVSVPPAPLLTAHS